ncbi:hypothetical protein [Micromonospora tarensis]|uniref:Uncharacterized protein n=1 Tax=Micromonospora tarensis TaxID=2806100 RepID=A0ABS1YCU6_9ACTN|nr:hypothetical protein [Micromonospora tarensis]MBM0275114.1 hypothetical protein [Micromonospora tarensis]
MTQQAALIHHPGRGGIWRKFLLPGRTINAAPWLDALAQHHPVGTCRDCGGYLKPGKPYRPAGSTRDWYPATCDTCKADTAAAGPSQRKKKRP